MLKSAASILRTRERAKFSELFLPARRHRVEKQHVSRKPLIPSRPFFASAMPACMRLHLTRDLYEYSTVGGGKLRVYRVLLAYWQTLRDSVSFRAEFFEFFSNRKPRNGPRLRKYQLR